MYKYTITLDDVLRTHDMTPPNLTEEDREYLNLLFEYYRYYEIASETVEMFKYQFNLQWKLTIAKYRELFKVSHIDAMKTEVTTVTSSENESEDTPINYTDKLTPSSRGKARGESTTRASNGTVYNAAKEYLKGESILQMFFEEFKSLFMLIF